jgi:predicted MFS family arabinose efflux permease
MPQSPAALKRVSNRRLVGSVFLATVCRILLNTARRFAYPFAPALGRELGVPLTAITSLIAVNQATGVAGLFFGPLADRFGYRLMMTAGMGMLIAGMFAAGMAPSYLVVMAALLLAGLGKTVFDPAIQAYAGSRIPFGRRGLVIGILEFSWAGSTLIGIPAMGFLIDRFGWRSPFFMLAVTGLVSITCLFFLLGRSGPQNGLPPAAKKIWSVWPRIFGQRAALGALGFGFFISAANDNLFVVYGVWLETSFQLGVVGLGLGTGLIGAAELLGEICTAGFADRLGLKRSVAGGVMITMLCYLVLPFCTANLSLAFGGLVVLFVVFEFTMVAFLSLSTELLPEWRASTMATILAGAGIGRMAGALLGGPVWLAGGIAATVITSAVISGLGLACLLWGLRDWQA